MHKILFIASLFLAATLATTLDESELRSLWSAWKSIHNKPYTSNEDDTRYGIFRENYEKILKFNSENHNIKLGLNKFADLTSSEFTQKYAFPRHKADNEAIARNTRPFDQNVVRDIPDEFDWRPKGAVTEVKEQGHTCGSCWAFSATGALEGFYFIKNGKLLSFSTQQIVSCDKGKNEGCNGGSSELAIEYVGKKGLELEKDYPYTAADDKCKFRFWKAIKINTGYQYTTSNNTDALKAAIANDGPVSIGVQGDQDIFRFYTSGTITSPECGADQNHVILAVGYTKDYFIVKNSWGQDWGMNGYVQIGTDNKINDGQGVCGILNGPVIVVWSGWKLKLLETMKTQIKLLTEFNKSIWFSE